ncbi:tail fiber protein [bacterium]|nr:tail fiber protein [bacterium]NDC93983.1 tail fiber protein [bacterium]NDD83288.1 tail fiber protein [bacterium]
MALQIPYSFQAGTVAEADKVNQNFDAVEAWANSAGVETQSIATLTARPDGPILSFEQTVDFPVMSLLNDQGNHSIYIEQTEILDAGKAVIYIKDDASPQTAGDAEIRLQLNAGSTIPAIKITYGGINSFLVKKDAIVLPNKTTAERNSIVSPEEGSLLYNTTRDELNVKRSDGWTPVGAPVGSIVMWPTATLPEGWLWCNGETLPNGTGTVHGVTANFSALYAVVGANLPNFVGLYPRGAQMNAVTSQQVSDGGNETYPASAINTKQRDATAINGLTTETTTQINTNDINTKSLEHTHTVGSYSNLDDPATSAASARTSGTGSSFATSNPSINLDHRHRISSTDTETRPATFSIGFIIKY